MTSALVLGIDGGGTFTRAVAADLTGHVLAQAVNGAGSPNKSVRARENMQEVIRDVVAGAGRSLGDVVELVAGIAGLDAPADQEWAERFTALPGLDCPRLHVNDAVVAHAGALQSQAGIIAISGTGSIVFGVTEAGRHVRNYDFQHYAHSAARHLAYDAVYRVLAEDTGPGDEPFIQQMVTFWNVGDLAGLRALGLEGFVVDGFERTQRFGELACLVTAAALAGVPLARSVCDRAANALGLGIRLVGGCFQEDRVRVALIGGAVRSPYMLRAMATELGRSVERQYEIIDPAFSCAVGAVLMALRRHEIPAGETILTTLRTTFPGAEAV